jgi:hypothetical protein
MLLGEAEAEYGKHIAKISNKANSFMPIAYHASRNSFWCRLYARILDPYLRDTFADQAGAIASSPGEDPQRLHLHTAHNHLLGYDHSF